MTPAYLGPAGVLTGAARKVQEARERAEEMARQHEIERQQRELDRKRLALESQIEVLRATYEGQQEDLRRTIEQSRLRENRIHQDREAMARLRQAEQIASVAAEAQTNGAGNTDDKNIKKEGVQKTKAKRSR